MIGRTRRHTGLMYSLLSRTLNSLLSLGRVSIMVCLGLALSLAACGHRAQRPPDSLLKQAARDERTRTEEERDLQRRHLAPPPAYGNKVVLAEAQATSNQL